jgi:hypothetical protein
MVDGCVNEHTFLRLRNVSIGRRTRCPSPLSPNKTLSHLSILHMHMFVAPSSWPIRSISTLYQWGWIELVHLVDIQLWSVHSCFLWQRRNRDNVETFNLPTAKSPSINISSSRCKPWCYSSHCRRPFFNGWLNQSCLTWKNRASTRFFFSNEVISQSMRDNGAVELPFHCRWFDRTNSISLFTPCLVHYLHG